MEELGADAFVYGHLAPVTAANTVVQVDPTAGTRQPEGTGGTEQIIVRVEGRTPPAAGSTIWVAPDAEHLHLFDDGGHWLLETHLADVVPLVRDFLGRSIPGA